MLNRRKRKNIAMINARLYIGYEKIKYLYLNMYSNIDVDMAIFKIKSLTYNRHVNSHGTKGALDIINFFAKLAIINIYQNTVIYSIDYASYSLSQNSTPSYRAIEKTLSYVADNFNYAQKKQNEIILSGFFLWAMWSALSVLFCAGSLNEDERLLINIRNDDMRSLMLHNRELLIDNENPKIIVNSIFCRIKKYTLGHLANVSNAKNIKEVIAVVNSLGRIFEPVFSVLLQLSIINKIPQAVMINHLLPFITIKDFQNLYVPKYNETYYLLGYQLSPNVCNNFLSPVINRFIDEEIESKYPVNITSAYKNYLNRNSSQYSGSGNFVNSSYQQFRKFKV